MRIVGGEFRGQALASPKSKAIRPTTDRVRESLFNILAHRDDVTFEKARVIDLFAGTGALGFEALSRGASFALFVDDGIEARGLIRANMEKLSQNGKAKIFRRDAAKLGEIENMTPFTLAFLDPPYGEGLGEHALQALHQGGWLAEQAIIVFEEAANVAVDIPLPYHECDHRVYGSSIVRLFRYAR